MELSISKLRARDHAEFARLISSTQSKALAAARSMLDDHLAEEAVQDAWVKVYQKIDQFENRADIVTWVIRIVINEAKQRLRKDARLDYRADLDLEHRFDEKGNWKTPLGTWHTDSPEMLFDRESLARCIDSTFASLPTNQSVAVCLKDREGLSLNEIGNILQLSASNVRVLIHRGRNRLLNKVDQFEETGEC